MGNYSAHFSLSLPLSLSFDHDTTDSSNSDDTGSAGRLHDSAAAATVVELAGAVQFPPSAFDAQRDRLREVFALRPPVRDLVARILSESRSGGIEDCSCDGRCVVSVHLGTALAGNSNSATRKPTER